MKEYVSKKLQSLEESFNNSEFIQLYAYVIRSKGQLTPSDEHEIATLLKQFVEKHREKIDTIKIESNLKQHVKRSYYQNINRPYIGVSKKKRFPMFYRRDGVVVDLVNLYEGKSIFFINNGPSFKHIDHEKLKLPGIITYGVNNGAHVFRPNIWSCVDDPSRFMRSIWEDPTIMKIIPQTIFEKPLWDNDQNKFSKDVVGDFPNVIGFMRNEFFDADTWLTENTINWGNHKQFGGGRSVMMASLRICHILGFKNVYLLGCDFDMSPSSKYFFEEQRTEASIINNNNSYKLMTERFALLRPKFEEVGFNVYNLNPNSNLTVFDFKDFDECIERERIDITKSTFGMYVSRKKS